MIAVCSQLWEGTWHLHHFECFPGPVGVGLPAKTAYQATHFHRMYTAHHK